jgi:hypothetical protein
MNSSSNTTHISNFRVGKWELRVELPYPVPANTHVSSLTEGVVTAIRAQGSKGWLKSADGRKWGNAVIDAQRLLVKSSLIFSS